MTFDLEALQRMPLREPEMKGLAAGESIISIIVWTIFTT